jgi:hypothetical protein
MLTMPQPELAMQTLRMPCRLYSGIKPPQALIDQMSRREQPVPQRRPSAAPSVAPPPFTERPEGPHVPLTQPGSPATDAVLAGAAPEGPPPSYEDAIADNLGPVDGNRGEYHQPESAPVVAGDEKRPSLFGH